MSKDLSTHTLPGENAFGGGAASWLEAIEQGVAQLREQGAEPEAIRLGAQAWEGLKLSAAGALYDELGVAIVEPGSRKRIGYFRTRNGDSYRVITGADAEAIHSGDVILRRVR